MKVVNHKDHNKSNNCIDNLEWVSQKENILYTYREKGTRNGKKRQKKVRCLLTGTTYTSVTDAAKQQCCSTSTIVKRCKEGVEMKYAECENIKNEVWKKHPRLDIYVSNMGRYLTKYGNKTHGYQSPTGYCTLKLDKISFVVHRLVAETFLKTDNLSLQVNHKDLDGYNNQVSNLEWVTQSENIKHSFKINKKRKRRKKKEKYNQEDLPNEVWKQHRNLPIQVSTKGRILHRGTKKYGSLDAGYRRIKINGKSYRVHILIAETFKSRDTNYSNSS